MKVLVKITEDYLPQTDDLFIRLNVVILRHVGENDYAPEKEFCVSFKKDCALSSHQVANSLKQLADKIEQYGP